MRGVARKESQGANARLAATEAEVAGKATWQMTAVTWGRLSLPLLGTAPASGASVLCLPTRCLREDCVVCGGGQSLLVAGTGKVQLPNIEDIGSTWQKPAKVRPVAAGRAGFTFLQNDAIKAGT